MYTFLRFPFSMCSLLMLMLMLMLMIIIIVIYSLSSFWLLFSLSLIYTYIIYTYMHIYKFIHFIYLLLCTPKLATSLQFNKKHTYVQAIITPFLIFDFSWIYTHIHSRTVL
ncbi:hypothetical protein F4703DRAFT_1817098 [Phycomyces blakesleeanus]